MVWDRYRRDPDRQAACTLAHAARLISDACSFAQLRLRFLLGACSASCAGVDEIYRQYQGLFADFDRAQEHFNDVEYGAASSQES